MTGRRRYAWRASLSTWLFVATALCPYAWAQAQSKVGDQADSVTQCLKQGDDEGLKLRPGDGPVEALVRVRMRFVSADAPPELDVLFSNAKPAVLEKVLTHVRRYRLPCWTPAAGPVRFVQEFSMRGSSWAAPMDLNAPQSLAAVGDQQSTVVESSGCTFRLPAFTPAPDIGNLTHPVNVEALIRFVPGQWAPEVELSSLLASKEVRKAVKRQVERYRMECKGEPYTGRFVQRFTFVTQDRDSAGFGSNPIPFAHWLGALKAPTKGAPYHDLNTMACPFSVEVTYRQPIARNDVKEVGDADPNRHLFLGWIETHVLKLPDVNQEVLHGERALIDVPCGVVDLR